MKEFNAENIKNEYVNPGLIDAVVSLADAGEWAYQHYDREYIPYRQMEDQLWEQCNPAERYIAGIRIRHLLSGGMDTSPEELETLRALGYIKEAGY
jgi:hypothetical protein